MCRPTLSPLFGPIANPRLCIIADKCSVSFKWQILFETIASGRYCFEEAKVYPHQLLPQSGYELCPGIKEYPSDVHFKTKKLREWGEPFNRLDSDACMLWHLPNSHCRPTGDPLRNACAPCKRLQFDIDQLGKRVRNMSEVKKAIRTSIGSNYPLKYLSPKSKAIRIARNTKERKNLSAKVSALTHFNCDLKDKQHTELLELVRSIYSKDSKDSKSSV